MSIRTLVCGTVAVAMVFSYSSRINAQRTTCHISHAGRQLGHGRSDGYQWRTPGPCVDYYNPWSFHNSSTRIGVIPQGAGPYLHRIESCGDVNYRETLPPFREQAGFGEADEFTFEPLPDQNPSDPGIDRLENNGGLNQMESQRGRSTSTGDHSWNPDLGEATQTRPSYANSTSGGDKGAVSGSKPNQKWAQRILRQLK